MSRIGKSPIPVPVRRDVTLDGQPVTVKGPKGTLAHEVPEPITVRQEGDVTWCGAPDDERQHARAARPDPHAGQQHGRRRDRRVPQGARDRRRRLPRHRPGAARPSSWRSVLPPGRFEAPAGITFEVPHPTTSASSASTSSWSARWPPTSARCASPSPTRARACATRGEASPARPGRPASRATSVKHKQTADGRIRRHRRIRKKVRRHRGPAAAGRVPLQPAHPRPDHRRRRRPHAGLGLHARDRAARPPTAATPRRRQVGRLLAERAKAAGIDQVVFDRGGFLYHGRVAALADAAREAGLEF